MPARELILGTAGHIDHGKTALVRALTGVDTDRLPAERARGISIDIGFAALDLDDVRLGIVDVPGHERFIKNMLAGASGVDLALLVVAADDSVMPQTREHLEILKLLGIRHGVIAITKIDLAEASWLDLVEEEVRHLVATSFLADAPIVRTSVADGRGLDVLRGALQDAGRAVAPRRETGLFRMAVDRSFALPGLGTVLTGTVTSGTVEAGDEIEWLPAGRLVRVRGIQRHGADVPRATGGQRAALDVSGAHHRDVTRGHVLATPGWLRASRRITVRLDLLPESPWPLRHRARLRLYVGTQEVMARVALLEGLTVAAGATAVAQLHCADPVVTVNRQPFVIRTESPLRTIGGGVVLQPAAARLGRRDVDAIGLLRQLDGDDERERAEAATRFLPLTTWSDADLARDASVTPDRAATLRTALTEEGVLVPLPVRTARPLLAHRAALETLEHRVLGIIRRQHDRHPLGVAVPIDRIAARLPRLERDLVVAVIDRMRAEGRLAGEATAVALPDFVPALTAGQRRLRSTLLERYQAAAFSPPDPARVAADAGVGDDVLQPILELCVQQNELAHVDTRLYLHHEWEQELRRRLTTRLGGGESLTVSEIRDLLGTSRKFAVPICEYLDRIGITERREDRRVLATESSA